MKTLAHLTASAAFFATLFFGYAYALSGGRFGAEAWIFASIYLFFLGPAGFGAIAAISHFVFRKRPVFAAGFYGLLFGVILSVFASLSPGLRLWAMAVGATLLSGIVREIVLYAFGEQGDG